jgi:hypothetical protein
MKVRSSVRGLVVLMAVAAGLIGGAAILATPVQAAKCCKVMVCSNTPPYACWEECRTCPRFP